MEDWKPEFLPEWGQLPVEQYLIRFWDNLSTQPASQQRETLISQFLQLDEILEEWDCTQCGLYTEVPPSRIPTEDEVAHILKPWRSQKLRHIAWKTWCCHKEQPLWVRTHYNPEDDGRLREWEEDSGFYEDEAWWSILNDREAFDFGADWKQIFYLLPEAAGGQNYYRKSWGEKCYRRALGYFKENLDWAKKRSDDDGKPWKEDLNASLIQGNPYAGSLIYYRSAWYIYVADEETFQTDELLLVFFDAQQNVIAQWRVPINMECIDEVSLHWGRGDGSRFAFQYGSIGEKYLIGGEIGRELYQLTKEDLE